MAGTDTIRGIAYQQAHAIHVAVALVDSYPGHGLRVEGMADVVDIEVLDNNGKLVGAYQVKSRTGSHWTPKPIAEVLRRWAALNTPGADFTFVTNGELGPGAQKLHDVLTLRGADRHKRLAKALGISQASAKRLSRARIRVDPSSVGALLSSAERRIAGLLDPLERDIRTVASQRVDTLFSVLTQRATHSDPALRLLEATELRDLVGGIRGERPEFNWAGALRATFLDAVNRVTVDLVPLTLYHPTSTGPVEAVSLLDENAASLSGATGTGKSSAVEMLQSTAAASGRAVVVCRAEMYTPGQLDALIADSLGFTIGTAVPTNTGRQVLSDPDAVLVIDGVSEIPQAATEHLAEDLKAVLTRPGLAAVVLVGRDPAVLRRVLSPAAVATAFTVSPLPRTAQDSIVKRVVGPSVAENDRTRLLHRATKALGDGVRNPMLLTIYLEAALDASAELSRADVYAKFVSGLGVRAPTVDTKVLVPVLGIVFARLLTLERRYSDQYEWIGLTDEAAGALSSSFDGSEVREAALRSGIVVELGVTGVVAPFHDSIADYLAASAVSSGAAALPSPLHDTQSEWVIFASELGVDVSAGVTRDLPFLSVRAADADRQHLAGTILGSRTAALLDTLLGKTGCDVSAKETMDGRRVLSANDATGVELGTTVIPAGRGALYAAVRLWRLNLRARLAARKRVLSMSPNTTEEARTLVRTFLGERTHEMRLLLDSLPPAQSERLLEKLRPLGRSYYIGTPEVARGTRDWPMMYVATPETRLLATDPGERAGRTSVGYFLDGGPARAVAAEVSEAVERLVDRKGWLA